MEWADISHGFILETTTDYKFYPAINQNVNVLLFLLGKLGEIFKLPIDKPAIELYYHESVIPKNELLYSVIPLDNIFLTSVFKALHKLRQSLSLTHETDTPT